MDKENIIVLFSDCEIEKMLIDLLDFSGLAVLKTESYEELFHASVYSNPKLFLIEFTEFEDDSFTVIKLLRKSAVTKDVPLLVVTKNHSSEVVDTLVNLGVAEILRYPFNDNLAMLRVNSILKAVSCYEAFDEMVKTKVQEMQDVQTVMIESLASLAEYRDPETGEHIKRTQNYVKAVPQTLFRHGEFTEELNEDTIELMYMSVPLHDVGKVGIRDDILLKPGRLNKEEFEVMKSHTSMGHEAINRTGQKLKNHTFLKYADDVAYTHQEKYDGSGYPRGLKGDEIPLIGRLMAIADVYDALISKRIYKDEMSHEEAIAIIGQSSGSHFDPKLVKYTLMIQDTFNNIALTYADTANENMYPQKLINLRESGVIKRIILVDDSRIIRSILRNQLEALGFEVEDASDGEEGYTKIMTNDYDLVLTDIEMPELNGYDLSKRIVQTHVDPPIIIAMTASDFDITEEKAERFGISGVLLKPVDLNRLEIKLEQIIESSKS